MQLEIVLCKEKAIYSFWAEMPPSSLDPKSSEMDVLWSDESTFQLVFGKIQILCAKDEKGHPNCYPGLHIKACPLVRDDYI